MLKLEIIGNLGADATVQNVNGNIFVSFRVAHSTTSKDSQGNAIETTTWISCTKNGENSKLIPYLKKGTKVFCRGTGSLRLFWSDKIKQNVAGLNMNVTELELCGSNKDGKKENLPFNEPNKQQDPIF